jgi:hypothetical protein
MLLSDLQSLCRLYVPQAKAGVVTSTVLDLIINMAIREIASFTAVLKTSQNFNVTASTGTYAISSFVTDFLTPDYPGLMWYDGSNWQRLVPETLESLDRKYPYWRDDAAGDPLRYSIDGDIITVHPKPSATLALGFKMHYAKTPATLSIATYYSFSGSATAMPHLEILNESILKFVRWKLAPIVGNTVEEIAMMEKDYKQEILEKRSLLNRRLDVFGYDRLQKGRVTIPDRF